MKAIFYFILGVLSIVFISQTQPGQHHKSTIENGVSTQHLLQTNGENITGQKTSKLSNKTVQNYLLNYLSNYTTSTTTSKQTITATNTKSNNTSTNNYSPSTKQNTYTTSKVATTYKKPSKSNYGYSKAKSSSNAYQPVKYKKAQPTEPITYYSNTYSETVQSPTGYSSTPAGATALCRDGTYSFSRNRRGTCSRHGGVRSWL